MSKTTKFILIGVALVAIIGIGYVLLSNNNSGSIQQSGLVSSGNSLPLAGSPSPTSQAPASPLANQADYTVPYDGTVIVDLLSGISSLRFDTRVFDNPQFSALQDYSITVSRPAVIGRRNPFAPIASTSTTTTSSQPSVVQTTTTAPVTGQ